MRIIVSSRSLRDVGWRRQSQNGKSVRQLRSAGEQVAHVLKGRVAFTDLGCRLWSDVKGKEDSVEPNAERARDAALGAIMGTFVGDALGLGCHWYYDLQTLRADYGPWITDYVTSKPDRSDAFASIAKYRNEQGLRAGDMSQTGQVTLLLLEAVVERGAYDQEGFTRRLDGLLEKLDGKPYSGRYTDWAMRDVWKQRRSRMAWADAGSRADTAEAAVRSAILAARFFLDPERLAKEGYGNIRLTHAEPYVAGQSLSFALALSALISKVPIGKIRGYLADLAEKEAIRTLVPSFDCLTQAANGAMAVASGVTIDPPSLICSLNGLNCTIGFMLPSVYYLIHRFPNDFEMAVLSAVNGGGNNMARAALTGALSGAIVGRKGIPERFISGLKDHERILDLAGKIAAHEGK
jgi:ADP-ribosyl-[dinitrogen reductase] hydrolase